MATPNTYLFLQNGNVKSFSNETYANADEFKVSGKFDVNESGEVRVYKTLQVEKNLIIGGNTTISGVINAVPAGVIVMWSGSSGTIPAGWTLCDGTNGTPDLRDRFVIGATSSYAVGASGGSKDAIVVSHNHTATSTSSVTDPGHVHNFDARGDDGVGSGAGYSAVGYNANIGSGSGNMSSATTGVTVSTTTTVASAGSSGTNANLPPYYALCFIMKT